MARCGAGGREAVSAGEVINFDIHVRGRWAWCEFAGADDLARFEALFDWIASQPREVVVPAATRAPAERRRDGETGHHTLRPSNAALLMRVDIGCLGHTEPSDSVDVDQQTVFVCVQNAPAPEILRSDHSRHEMVISDHLPEHEALLDYFVERAFIAWTRSRT